jgi:hypothetical protein
MEVHSIETIVRALNGARVKYLIVGGVAVVAHGYERFTKALDLVIGLERENIIRGLRALMTIGCQMRIPVTPGQFADPARREQWRREKNMVVLPLWSDTHRRTPIDVFVYEPFDFAKELARARRELVFGKESAAIVSYETLLDLKKSVTKKQLYAHPGWPSCTFEGAELSTLLLGLQSTFREKLEWLEEAETLTLQLRASREKARTRKSPAR